jgi:hypothetical protein
MGTALAVTPELPSLWRDGKQAPRALRPVTWSDKTLAAAAAMALVRHQLRRMSRGASPRVGVHPAWALVVDQAAGAKALRHYRTWLKANR